jgi:hypothetical protein
MLGTLFWPLGMAILLSLAFPNFSQGATLSGTVYVDLNGDGAIEQGDWGVRKAVIQLFDENDQFLAQVLSNAQGQYSFADLAAGAYTVKNTTPCSEGSSADIGQIMNASNVLIPSTGDPNSAMAQISNIVLQLGDKAINYNFGNDYYPLQLYSKQMLTFNSSSQVQEAIITPVPEPTMIALLLPLGGMICGWVLSRSRRSAS